MRGRWEMAELNRTLPEVLLRRTGSVAGAPAGQRQPVSIEKRYVFRPRSIDVYYELRNSGDRPLSAIFAVELNLSLAARTPESGRLFILGDGRKTEYGLDRNELASVQSLLVRDVTNEVSITVSSARAFRSGASRSKRQAAVPAGRSASSSPAALSPNGPRTGPGRCLAEPSQRGIREDPVTVKSAE